jgi:hypothetical protein
MCFALCYMREISERSQELHFDLACCVVFCYCKANFASYLHFPHSEHLLIRFVSSWLCYARCRWCIRPATWNAGVELASDLFTLYCLVCAQQQTYYLHTTACFNLKYLQSVLLLYDLTIGNSNCTYWQVWLPIARHFVHTAHCLLSE